MPLQKYAWLITMIIAWILFFLLVDWSRLKYTVWGGVMTSAFQILVDTGAMKLHLYRVETLIKLFGSSATFSFGVVFVVGILIAQTLPASRWLQALNILAITIAFSLQEILFVKVGVLEYLNWNHLASIFIDLMVLISYTWLVDSLGVNRAGRKGTGGYKL